MADHPLRPATDRGLGRPLPYQLANRTWAHPGVRAYIQRPPFSRRTYAVLARVSPGCPPLQGRFPRITHPSATLLGPKPFRVRLACVKHAASVQSEPGSNSSVLFRAALASGDPLLDGSSLLKMLRRVTVTRCQRSTHTSYPNKLLMILVATVWVACLPSGKTAYFTGPGDGVKRSFQAAVSTPLTQTVLLHHQAAQHLTSTLGAADAFRCPTFSKVTWQSLTLALPASHCLAETLILRASPDLSRPLQPYTRAKPISP